MFCIKCGKELAANVKICPDCGQQANEDVDIQPQTIAAKEDKKEQIINFILNPLTIIIVVLIIGISGMIKTELKREEIYKDVQIAMKAKDYAQARIKMDSIKGFKDVSILKKEADYNYFLTEGDKAFNKNDLKLAKENWLKAQQASDTKIVKDKLAIIKAKREARKKQLENKLRFKKDDISEATYIRAKSSPIYINMNGFYLQIYKSGSYKSLELFITYTGDDWIFWENALINVDGDKKYINLKRYSDVKSDNDITVWEYAILDYEKYADIVQSIANSSSAKIRLYGNQHSFDRTISNTEKQALKDILEYYEMMD